ncbi:MAG TPA: hypothetical protein VMH20_20635, partial [Verrucomicrobiae bacterium]|nr:hypothetical protein [Verrucomicrobiae bacterium]
MAKRGKYGFGRIYQPKYRDKTTGELRICSKYYIQYYDQNGCQHREPTEAATEREARGILATRLAQVQAGTAPHITEKSMRYGDLRKLLLDDYRAERNKSLQHLANGQETVKGLTKLDEFFQFKEGTDQGMKVSAITRELFDQFITARRAEGVSDATISNSAKALRRMLSLGVEAGKISKR